jgi:hypothetical protein
VQPRDVECEGFNLTYPRIVSDKTSGLPSLNNTMDKKVDDGIGSFLLTLSQIGPELLSVSDCFTCEDSFSALMLNFRVSYYFGL